MAARKHNEKKMDATFLFSDLPRYAEGNTPRILGEFVLPTVNFRKFLRTFRQSFASYVLKNRDIFCYCVIFLPIPGSLKSASSDFDRLGQNPAGVSINSQYGFILTTLYNKMTSDRSFHIYGCRITKRKSVLF